jgi:nitrous oxidase accessory protein NosD
MVPLCGEAATLNVNCDAGEKIQQKIAVAKPGDEIIVSGTCNENDRVLIPSEIVRLTLNGQGKATIQVSGTTGFPIYIRGKEITIKGFTLVGGLDGVHLSGAAAGASAIIDNNIIRRTARFGIHIDSGSVAQIANNRIEDVGAAAIDVIEHSVARIGFLIPAQPPLGPNIIRNAGSEGIAISRGSSAWIVGNTITGNKGSGILITRNAQADILANSINANGGNAITVTYSSGINFSSEGTPRREGPNKTDPQEKNAGFGVSCMVGGHVAGPLGTLAGMKGAKEFDNTCVDKVGLP